MKNQMLFDMALEQLENAFERAEKTAKSFDDPILRNNPSVKLGALKTIINNAIELLKKANNEA